MPIINEVEKYVLNGSLTAMKDEYKVYERYFYENEEEFLDDNDYEELSEELFEAEDLVDEVNDRALKLLHNDANDAVDADPGTAVQNMTLVITGIRQERGR